MEVAPGIWISHLYCAWLERAGAVVVADLHLGMEASAAADGAHYPKRQLPLVERRLRAVLDEFRPELVVVAGDLKHDFGPVGRSEREEVERVFELMISRADVALVRGNHDNYLKGILPGQPLPDHVVVGGAAVFHGHRSVPALKGWSGPRIMGHEHPALKLRDPVGAAVSAPAFLWDEGSGLLVLPALSPLAGGSDPVRGRPMSPLLADRDRGRLRVLAVCGSGLLDFGRAGDIGPSGAVHPPNL